MTLETDNTKTILRLGFAAMTLLLLVVAVFSLNRVDKLTQQLSAIVEYNIYKIELVSRMRRSVEERWIDLHKVIASHDIFERDKWLQNFYKGSRLYREARNHFSSIPHTKTEQDIFNRLDKNIKIAQPIVRQFIENMVDDPLPFPPENVVDQIKRHQQSVLNNLQQMVDYVQEDANAAVNEAKSDLTQTYTIMLILVSSIILLSLIIATRVSESVNKKNQALANATKVKSRFLANMSHEIRTPLTAVIGFAEQLLKPELSQSERLAAANIIIRNGSHLQNIVDEILDLSKDEANKLEANKTQIALLELIAEIKETFEPQASKKDLLFQVHQHPPLPTYIISDPFKLKQILYNLCNNAIKYTEKGTVSFNISCNTKAQQIHFDIVDSGIGLKENDLQNIFEPFVQADNSATRKFGGTGLGLHLSRRFSELLGGTLSVDSNYGVGSCFTLSMPTGEIDINDLKLEFQDQAVLPNIQPDDYPLDQLNGNILLAEDTQDNQLLIRAFLTNTNIQLSTVDDGQQAIDAIAKNEFDLVLMDIQMPVMNGLQATSKLRQLGFTKPILALTANILPEDCERYLKEGFDDVIGKPVSKKFFLEKLSTYFLEKRMSANQSVYSTLLNEGPEFLPAIEYFVLQAANECKQLNLLLDTQNWDELQQQLHRLKGSGGGVGFAQVTKFAKEAEEYIKNIKFTDARECIGKLTHLLNRLRIQRD